MCCRPMHARPEGAGGYMLMPGSLGSEGVAGLCMLGLRGQGVACLLCLVGLGV